MRSVNWRSSNRNHGKEARAFPVFRYRRGEPADPNVRTLPFTEIPDDLKRGRFSFGRLVRGFFNFLLLLILGLALVALVLAFAYQMTYHPDVLRAQASSIVTPVVNFFQTIIFAGK